MPVTLTCGWCGKPFKVAESLVGKTIDCVFCGATILIPHVAAADPGAREARRRKAAATALGLLLVASAAMPTFPPDRAGKPALTFPNFVELTAPGSALAGRCMAAFPVAAGALVIVAAFALRTRLRGTVMLALFAAAGTLLVIEPTNRRYLPEVLCESLLWERAQFPRLFGAGVAALLVAGCARRDRPGWRWLYVFSLAGAAAVACSQVLPAPDAPTTVRIARAVSAAADAARAGHERVSSASAAGALAMLALSALLSVAAFPGLKAGAVRGLSRAALVLAAIGLVVFVAGWLAGGILRDADPARTPWPQALEAAKAMATLLGIGVLLPAGLTNLIVGAPPAGRAPAKRPKPTGKANKKRP